MLKSTVRAIIANVGAGVSYKKTAKHYNVSMTTVMKYCKLAGVRSVHKRTSDLHTRIMVIPIVCFNRWRSE